MTGRPTCPPCCAWSTPCSATRRGPRACWPASWPELASGRYYLVAEDGGGLAGYAGLLTPGGGQADVLTLAVAEPRHGARASARRCWTRCSPRRPGGAAPRCSSRCGWTTTGRSGCISGAASRRSASGAATTSRPGTDALVMRLSLDRPGRGRLLRPAARSGPRYARPTTRRPAARRMGGPVTAPAGAGHRDVLRRDRRRAGPRARAAGRLGGLQRRRARPVRRRGARGGQPGAPGGHGPGGGPGAGHRRGHAGRRGRDRGDRRARADRRAAGRACARPRRTRWPWASRCTR